MYSRDRDIVCCILWMNLNMNSSSRQKLQSCSITRGVLVCKTGIYGIRCQNLLVLLFPFFKAIWPLINPEANFIAAFLGTFASLDEINVWLHRFLFHDRYLKCTLRLWHVAVHQKIRQIPEWEVDSLQVCFLKSPWCYSYTGITTSVLLTKPWSKAICVLSQITSIIEMVHGYICSKLPKDFRKVWGELYNCFLSTLYFHALVMLLISEVSSENFKVILTTETETFTI